MYLTSSFLFADFKLNSEFPRKSENVDRYGASPGGSLERSMKPITFAQLDRPATPLLVNKEAERSNYDEAPPRPPMPNHTDHGQCKAIHDKGIKQSSLFLPHPLLINFHDRF